MPGRSTQVIDALGFAEPQDGCQSVFANVGEFEPVRLAEYAADGVEFVHHGIEQHEVVGVARRAHRHAPIAAVMRAGVVGVEVRREVRRNAAALCNR